MRYAKLSIAQLHNGFWRANPGEMIWLAPVWNLVRSYQNNSYPYSYPGCPWIMGRRHGLSRGWFPHLWHHFYWEALYNMKDGIRDTCEFTRVALRDLEGHA